MTVERALVAAASFGLPGARCTDATLDTDADVAGFIIAMRMNGVHGLVAEADRAGALQGPGLATRVEEAHHGVLLTCLAAEAAAVEAADALASVGVEMVALKGLAHTHLDYPSPEWRVFGDADVLIPAAGYDRALSVLEKAGFQRRLPPARRGWERRFGRTVTHDAPNQAELDVHLRIAGGYFGFLIDHNGLWARATDSFTLAGRPIRALDRTDRLLHACYHAVLGDHSGLRSRRDVAQLLLVCGADWSGAVQRATAEGCDGVVAHAIRSAWADLDLDPAVHPAARWAMHHQVDTRQARAIGAYAATFASDWSPEGQSALDALGPLDRVRYLAGLAYPTRASLAARGRTRTEHLRRLVRHRRARV